MPDRLEENSIDHMLDVLERLSASNGIKGICKEPFEYGGSDDHLKQWIYATELFFQIGQVPREQHYAVAKSHLKDRALVAIEFAETEGRRLHGGNYVPMS